MFLNKKIETKNELDILLKRNDELSEQLSLQRDLINKLEEKDKKVEYTVLQPIDLDSIEAKTELMKIAINPVFRFLLMANRDILIKTIESSDKKDYIIGMLAGLSLIREQLEKASQEVSHVRKV